MAVYVDDMMAPYRGMLMCHLVADTTEELLAVVDKIGVQRKWIQNPRTQKEHFDIASSKRTLALKLGVIPITWTQLSMMCGIRESKSSQNVQMYEDHLTTDGFTYRLSTLVFT